MIATGSSATATSDRARAPARRARGLIDRRSALSPQPPRDDDQHRRADQRTDDARGRLGVEARDRAADDVGGEQDRRAPGNRHRQHRRHGPRGRAYRASPPARMPMNAIGPHSPTATAVRIAASVDARDLGQPGTQPERPRGALPQHGDVERAGEREHAEHRGNADQRRRPDRAPARLQQAPGAPQEQPARLGLAREPHRSGRGGEREPDRHARRGSAGSRRRPRRPSRRSAASRRDPDERDRDRRRARRQRGVRRDQRHGQRAAGGQAERRGLGERVARDRLQHDRRPRPAPRPRSPRRARAAAGCRSPARR